jgi:hypothetical protein
MSTAIESGSRSVSLAKTLLLLLAAGLVGYGIDAVARWAGIPVKFRLLGVSLRWSSMVASVLFVAVFHAVAVRTVPK